MTSKYDEKDDKYSDDGKDGGEYFGTDVKGCKDDVDLPKIEITAIHIDGSPRPVSDPIDLRIVFELDRDVICAYWTVSLLVDSAENRLIKRLGNTSVEDYTEGDSEMRFYVDRIDVSDIPPSTLANSGLLIAALVVDGEEIACVNMVVSVYAEGGPSGKLIREIFNPLE